MRHGAAVAARATRSAARDPVWRDSATTELQFGMNGCPGVLSARRRELAVRAIPSVIWLGLRFGPLIERFP